MSAATDSQIAIETAVPSLPVFFGLLSEEARNALVSALVSALSGIEAGDVSAIRSAIYSASAVIPAKPKRADYADTDSFKEAMNEWAPYQRAADYVKTGILRAAKDAGCAVVDKYSATVGKTGNVAVRHTESVTFKASFAKAKL